MGWLSGYHYRKRITLSRASGAVTNYQMKILIGESSGASGEDADCGGKVLSSFNDLRFTASNGTTLLDYWIESVTGTTPNQLATVWVEFDSIGTSDTYFYMYYGHASAPPASSGANTFILFDDFERGSDGDAVGGGWAGSPSGLVLIDTARHYGGTRSVIVKHDASYSANMLRGPSVYLENTQSLMFRLYKKTQSFASVQIHIAGVNDIIYLQIDKDENIGYYVTSFQDTGYNVTADAWGLFEVNNINLSAETFDIRYNDVKIKSGAALRGEAGTCYGYFIFLNNIYNSLDDFYVDNVIVRNWRSTEPAWGSWGTEEEEPLEQAVNISTVFAYEHQVATQTETGTLTASFDYDYLSPATAESAGINAAFACLKEYWKTFSESSGMADVFEAANTTEYVNESGSIRDVPDYLHLADDEDENLSASDLFESDLSLKSIEESLSADVAFTAPASVYAADLAVSGTTGDAFSGGKDIVPDDLYEIAQAADALECCYQKNETVDESLMLAEALFPGWGITLTDNLNVWESLIHGWEVTADESLALEDTTAERLIVLISDWITLVDSQGNHWNGREIVPETLNLYDVARAAAHYAEANAESLALEDAPALKLTVAVLEYMGFGDLAGALRTGAESVNEAFVLTDVSLSAYQFIIGEVLSAVDSAGVITAFVDCVQELLGMEDAASACARVGAALGESLVLTETISSRGTLYDAVYDTLRMNPGVELSGEVYECYVLSTPEFHPSMYSGFDFNSYCVFENRAFGANDTGIYELTGDTDAGNPIHTGVILSETDFGSRNYKRFRKGYVGISGTSPVMILECEDGTRKVYDIDSRGIFTASGSQKSRAWKLSVAGFETLDAIKLIPVILSK